MSFIEEIFFINNNDMVFTASTLGWSVYKHYSCICLYNFRTLGQFFDLFFSNSRGNNKLKEK